MRSLKKRTLAVLGVPVVAAALFITPGCGPSSTVLDPNSLGIDPIILNAIVQGAITALQDPNSLTAGGVAGDSSQYPLLAQQFFNGVNEARQRRNLPALTWNDKIAAAAQLHAAELVTHDPPYFSHYSPNGDDPGVRMAKQGLFVGYGYTENIGSGRTAEEAVADLQTDVAHLLVMLDPASTHMGVGVYYLPPGTYSFPEAAPYSWGQATFYGGFYIFVEDHLVCPTGDCGL